jgi:hypothetical protein
VLRHAFAISTAFLFAVSQISPGFAQQLKEIEARTRELDARLERLSDLVDRMAVVQERMAAAQAARIEEERLSRRYAGPDGSARAVTDVQRTRAEVDRAKTLMEQLQPAVIGSEAHQVITKCIAGAAAAADRAVANGGRLGLNAQESGEPRTALGCDERGVKEAMDALEARRRQAVLTWQSCQQSLSSIRDLTLPSDPSGLNAAGRRAMESRMQRLQERVKAGTLPPEAADCARNVQSAYETITQTEDASAAVASALALAAQVCMASGANPYVCGAMLLVALIMNMRGGGGSGGDGEGSGTSRRGRPGTGTLEAGGVPSEGRPAPPQTGGGGAGGLQTVLGDKPDGQFRCVSEGASRIACGRVGDADARRSVVIDATSGEQPEIALLRSRMTSGSLGTGRVVFCGTGDGGELPFRSLAVFDQGSRQLSSIALNFGQPPRRDDRGRLTPSLQPEPMRTITTADPSAEQMCRPGGN